MFPYKHEKPETAVFERKERWFYSNRADHPFYNLHGLRQMQQVYVKDNMLQCRQKYIRHKKNIFIMKTPKSPIVYFFANNTKLQGFF